MLGDQRNLTSRFQADFEEPDLILGSGTSVNVRRPLRLGLKSDLPRSRNKHFDLIKTTPQSGYDHLWHAFALGPICIQGCPVVLPEDFAVRTPSPHPGGGPGEAPYGRFPRTRILWAGSSRSPGAINFITGEALPVCAKLTPIGMV